MAQKKVLHLAPRRRPRRGRHAASAARASGLAAHDQGISVQLEVPGPSTSPATELRCASSSPGSIAAHFANRLRPGAGPLRVPGGRPHRRGRLPLLAGQVEIFWRGGFVGRQAIGARGAGRALPPDLRHRRDASRWSARCWRRSSARRGSSAAPAAPLRVPDHDRRLRQGDGEVELDEQIPVSEVDDVRVSVDPNTTPRLRAAAQDGLLTWKLALDAGRAAWCSSCTSTSTFRAVRHRRRSRP